MSDLKILRIAHGRFFPPWPSEHLLTAGQIDHGTKVRRELKLQPTASPAELAEARQKEQDQ